MNRIFVKGWLALVIILFANPSSAQETINKVFEGISEMDIEIASGDVVLQKARGNDVTVELTHNYNFDYNPKIEKRGDRLVIEEDRQRQYRYSGSAEWVISMPDGLEVELNTGSGDIDITALDMEADLNSGSGKFKLRDSQGDYKINTGSGDIDVSNCEGELRLNCGSGDIDLEDMTAAIKANVGSGDIEAEGITLTERGNFNSGSGDVSVSLSDSPGYDISVNSGSGDATLDFNGNKIEGTLVMQANKNNGRIRAPFDFDSEEEIDNGWSTTIKKTKVFSNKDIEVRVSSGSGTASLVK